MNSLVIFITLTLMMGWVLLVIDCQRYQWETLILIEHSLSEEE